MSKDLKLSIVVILVTGVVIVVTLWPLLFETAYGYRESQHEVRDFVGRLTLGTTRPAIDQLIARQQYGKLAVRHRLPKAWHIGTPGTFGATDWSVTLQFHDDGLECVIVGTADDWSRPPQGAPSPPCRARSPERQAR